MKTAKDPRHIKRVRVMKALFAESFHEQDDNPKMAIEIMSRKKEIDKKIEKAAPMWPTDKLNKVDLSILRLSIHELDSTSTPPKVIIDEAVEIAKEFGSENSAGFINGVLGTIYKKIKKDDGDNVKSE